jgi:hypothetical protein
MKIVLSLFLILWFPAREVIPGKHPGYNEALSESGSSKKHILILFTGKKCAEPLKASDLIGSSQRINDIIQSEYIFLELFVDDSTPLSNEEGYRSSSGAQIRTVGDRNADLELEVFAANVQPYYVIVDWDGVVIKTSRYMASADELIKFLTL